MPDGHLPGRGRSVAAVLTLVLLGLSGLPAAADTATPPDPSAQVDAAKAQLGTARADATAQDTVLAQAQQSLAAAQQRLAALQQQIQDLDTRIAADAAHLDDLRAQQRADQQQLAGWLRTSYERGLDRSFIYVVTADSFGALIQRQEEVNRTADAARDLVRRIDGERSAAAALVVTERQRRADLQTAQDQAGTAEALVAAEESRVRDADFAAWTAVQQAQGNLQAALAAKREYDAAMAALAAARSQSGAVFSALAGSTFTVDTDLTQPSGLDAARIDHFLAGTAMAGLGGAFMAAERTHHVSARYFVAHGIEESAWGSSRIAQDKHNLFGFGADDAHPYEDAMSFPSFAACIDHVAGYVARHYLSPDGSFYHGPTLRGMNVDYASDPHWADNIARIARTIP